ncbi:hypothetical protein M9H77_31580 [Catharanthus roseus]|uniref:Uncharacterized protein n=1 Tax=Catharanthus roseus TaxID=4058 RepID=A0ACC0A2U5_CATRO|nr:hypothetical protein M9H77_31580 [Catharanthus roseus]
MRVYISNSANCDTRTVGYQPTGVDRRMMTSILQEVDDMATGVIQGPPSSLTQITSFAKKVQTIIRRCMVSIGGILGCTASQYDISRHFQCIHHVAVPKSPYRTVVPPHPGTVSSSFQTPPPPGMVGSSIPYMPISYASSSDSDKHDDEQTDDVALA